MHVDAFGVMTTRLTLDYELRTMLTLIFLGQSGIGIDADLRLERVRKRSQQSLGNFRNRHHLDQYYVSLQTWRAVTAK